MTLALRRGARDIPAPATPALASLALAPWLCSPPRPARVIGVSTDVAWCSLDDQVILLSSPDAVRFPNAVLAEPGCRRLEPGDEIVLGSGGLTSEAMHWQVVRWWDPHAVPVDASRTEVLARLSGVERTVSQSTCLPLIAALTSGDHRAILDQVRSILGGGSGLTPEGDDRLIGAFAAFRDVGSSVGRSTTGTMLDEVADEILALASHRTGSLSVTLLRHSLAGEVPDPVAGLLRALTGRGDLTAAVDRCLAVGGSSGLALAEGVLCGARAACEMEP